MVGLDIDGVMHRLLDDLPTLEEHHRAVMDVFRDQGLNIDRDRAECVEVLADVRLRAEFTLKPHWFLEALHPYERPVRAFRRHSSVREGTVPGVYADGMRVRSPQWHRARTLHFSPSPPQTGYWLVDAIDRADLTVPVIRVSPAAPPVSEPDAVAVEEPLEIRLGHGPTGGRVVRPVAVTMRTPGHDPELAVGFLFTEGVIAGPGDVAGVHRCGRKGNVVRVDLHPGRAVDPARLDRHSYTGSGCGVCGKTSLAAVRVAAGPAPAPGRPAVDADVLRRLPDRLRAAQPGFDRTGGLHASGLFDPAGRLLDAREDVGRHNALDKLIGRAVLDGRVPLSGVMVLVSGRVGFELVQKSAVAGVPVLAGVGAPSSLAVELARDRGITLIGFLRADGFNVYSHPDRIAADGGTTRPGPRAGLPLPVL